MQSAFNRLLQKIRKHPLSRSRSEKVRLEARQFAEKLLNTYALQTAQQPIPVRRRRAF